MSDREMTLMMRIRAKGDEAKAVLRQLEGQLKTLGGAASSFGHGFGKVAGWAGSAASMLLRPLVWATKAAGALGVAMMGLGGAALKAAADDQALISRLTGVYGSAKKAEEQFAQLEALSRKSAFKTDDLAEATILLEQYGMGGRKNLLVIGAAAKVAGADLRELTLQVMALQNRGLKRFGIDLETDTKTGTLTASWRDKMGKLRSITAQTEDEMRRGLMGVFEGKFGIKVRPTTLNGLVQMFKNNMEQVFANLGDPWLKTASAFVERISTGLTNFIESGKLTEWGEKIGDMALKASDNLRAAFAVGQAVVEGLNAGGAAAWGEAINIVFVAAARSFVGAVMSYLSASATVFAALGKIIAGAFVEEALQLPGMSAARESRAEANLKGMTPEQAVGFGVPQHVANIMTTGGSGAMFTEESRMKALKDWYGWVKAHPKEASAMASGDRTAMLGSAAADFTNGIPTIAGGFAKQQKEIWGNAYAQIAKLSGAKTDFGMKRDSYGFARDKAGMEELQASMRRYTVRTPFDQITDISASGVRRARGFSNSSFIAPEGKFNVGSKLSGGGTVIHIASLVVRANDPTDLKNKLNAHANRPALSAAGN